jgi:hypothetical protein
VEQARFLIHAKSSLFHQSSFLSIDAYLLSTLWTVHFTFVRRPPNHRIKRVVPCYFVCCETQSEKSTVDKLSLSRFSLCRVSGGWFRHNRMPTQTTNSTNDCCSCSCHLSPSWTWCSPNFEERRSQCEFRAVTATSKLAVLPTTRTPTTAVRTARPTTSLLLAWSTTVLA